MIKIRAKKLHVIGIHISGASGKNDFDCLESVLDIINECREDISVKAAEKNGIFLCFEE